jgi:hypothetical protein
MPWADILFPERLTFGNWNLPEQLTLGTNDSRWTSAGFSASRIHERSCPDRFGIGIVAMKMFARGEVFGPIRSAEDALRVVTAGGSGDRRDR